MARDTATMGKTTKQLLEDLATLAQWQQRTLTQDPDHPVLRALLDGESLTGDDALWLTMLYFAYMHLPSAWRAFSAAPTLRDLPVLLESEVLLRLPHGFERRGLRVPAAMTAHLIGLREMARQYGSLYRWLIDGFGSDPYGNWDRLQHNLQVLYGNGRWAAYNTGEAFMNVFDWPVLPRDMGMESSTGPRSALALFYGEVQGNSPRAIMLLNAQAEDLLADLHAMGIRDLRIDQLETVLCDFKGMIGADHYIGHYPDLLYDQLRDAEERGGDMGAVWHARREALPEWSLCEGQSGVWLGARKDLLRCYAEYGIVEWWRVYERYPRPGL